MNMHEVLGVRLHYEVERSPVMLLTDATKHQQAQCR